MKLLMCTQVIDQHDPALGFFHRWVEQFATHYEQVTVICLKEGAHDLPQHVRVLSLGKERGVSRLRYVTRFFQYIWQEKNEYDAVFVHMNEEYVLLGALLWKVLGKRVYLWRNHYAGSWRTRCAAWLSTKVFYTSQSSYTAQFKNAVQMPVGVDLERFKPVEGVVRKPRSILFLGRISPSKKPDVLVEALGILKSGGTDFTASFYGPVSGGDEAYAQRLRERVVELGIADRVHFGGVLTHAETPRVYQEHAVYINLADSGMYDKTLFEAAASGCVVLSTSRDFASLGSHVPIGKTEPAIVAALRKSFVERDEHMLPIGILREHTLKTLIKRLCGLIF